MCIRIRGTQTPPPHPFLNPPLVTGSLLGSDPRGGGRFRFGKDWARSSGTGAGPGWRSGINVGPNSDFLEALLKKATVIAFSTLERTDIACDEVCGSACRYFPRWPHCLQTRPTRTRLETLPSSFPVDRYFNRAWILFRRIFQWFLVKTKQSDAAERTNKRGGRMRGKDRETEVK
ncbi:hypothetical protein LX36DRAFT_428228 [Colletotrichum falcatum]|nr:hypothetical protein LX36DRAFT_428228 [Colletotrichum falcatum]